MTNDYMYSCAFEQFSLLFDTPLIFIFIPQSTLSHSLQLVLLAAIDTYSSYFIVFILYSF